MRGTIQINSKGEKVFLPELPCDFFIGSLKPNQHTIDKDSFLIKEEEISYNENDIVFANINYKSKLCYIIGLDDSIDE